jgi:putative transposase
LGRKKEEREKGDERILGSGDFVNEALSKAGEDWEKRGEKKMLLAELIQIIVSYLDLREESIFSSSRRQEISEARAIISCLAINDMPAPCSAACS